MTATPTFGIHASHEQFTPDRQPERKAIADLEEQIRAEQAKHAGLVATEKPASE